MQRNRGSNTTFYVVVGFALVVLLFSLNRSNVQDRIYQGDYLRYVQASELFNQQQCEEAGTILADLAARYPSSFIIAWKLGFCLAAKGRFAEATGYYEQALRQNPFLVQESLFLLQYGDFLHREGREKEAIGYLEASLIDSTLSSDLVDYAKRILTKIGQKGVVSS